MKSLLILSITCVILFCGCKEGDSRVQKQSNDVVSSLPVVKPENEVVFVLIDSIPSLFMNVWTNPYQIKPDIMSIGMRHQNNPVIIPTDSMVKLSINHTHDYNADGKFLKGDTVHIRLRKSKSYSNNIPIEYPYFLVVNRTVNLHQLNFDYYISLKTPTAKTFRIYSMFTRMKKIKNPFTADSVYKNIVATADSLFKEEKLTKKFYEEKTAEAKVMKTKDYLDRAFRGKFKINIDSVISLVQKVSLPEYDFAQNFLIAALNYKYFYKRKKYAKNSELFNVLITSDTLLNSDFKDTVLDKLLTHTYVLERSYFDSCLVKFRKRYPDSEEYTDKYNRILALEQEDKVSDSLFKNDSGKLLALKDKKTLGFEKVLKKETGKVVLVDFWASWCAPCRSEIPSLRMLEKELDSTKFTIIPISIDKSINSWTKASEQEKLDNKEHNYLLLDATKSLLTKNLDVDQIPRYILFNKKGELVSRDAPKPSEGKELRTLINKHLND